MRQLNNHIASTTAQIARLKARYTNQHSEIQIAKKVLEKLHQERNSLLHFSVNADPKNTQQLKHIKVLRINSKTHYDFKSLMEALFYFGLSLMSGLSIGVGLAIIGELTDTSIRTRKQLVEITKIPVISRIAIK